MFGKVFSFALLSLFLFGCQSVSHVNIQDVKNYFQSKEFRFQEVSGIGYEAGCTRRDNSDIIRIGDKYYLYYTKVTGRSPGYWGSIWAAVSEDEGHSWKELGEVLASGEKGQWDSQAVFTPNIIEYEGVYYLYYTGVQPTPTNQNGEFENNSVNDYTAIGLAKSVNPEGPFVRCDANPVLTVGKDHADFDSYRVDDAVMLKKDRQFWMYYKGRKYADGNYLYRCPFEFSCLHSNPVWNSDWQVQLAKHFKRWSIGGIFKSADST